MMTSTWRQRHVSHSHSLSVSGDVEWSRVKRRISVHRQGKLFNLLPYISLSFYSPALFSPCLFLFVVNAAYFERGSSTKDGCFVSEASKMGGPLVCMLFSLSYELFDNVLDVGMGLNKVQCVFLFLSTTCCTPFSLWSSVKIARGESSTTYLASYFSSMVHLF